MAELISVRFDPAAWSGALDRLGRDLGIAVARGVNRTIQQAQTVMVRAIASDMAITQSVVRDRLSIEKASADAQRWTARLYADVKRIPLIAFNANGLEPSRGRGTGVSARLPTGRQRYPRAFIATMHTGHRGVFERKGKARLPIHELRGPSVYHVFQNLRDLAQARADEMLMGNVSHEVEFLLSQIAA